MNIIQSAVAIVAGLLILLILEWREEGKFFKPDFPRYALSLIIGVVSCFVIDNNVMQIICVIGIIVLMERIYRALSKASK